MARRAPTLNLGGVVADALEFVGGRSPGRPGDPVTRDPVTGTPVPPGDPVAGDPVYGDPLAVAVLDAVAGLLAEYGLRRWSIDDVADRAGLARATVYRRFESRDAMIHVALARDASRFFEAIAGAVRHLERLDDQVVAGFVTGLRMARRSPLTPLLRDASAAADGAAMTALVTIAGSALADRYRALTTGARDRAAVAPEAVDKAVAGAEAMAGAEAVAGALVRLGLSYLLAPAAGVDLDDEGAARAYFAPIIRPLVVGAPADRPSAGRPPRPVG